MNHFLRPDAQQFTPGAFLDSAPGKHALDLDTDFSEVFDHFSDALILADGKARVTYLNAAAERMLGFPQEKACGFALDNVLTLQDGVTRQPLQLADFPKQNAAFTGTFHLLVSNGGGTTPVQYSVARTRSLSGVTSGYIVLLRDASGLQQYIDRLRTQSMHDEHTRLLRRAELVKRLWRLLHEADDGEPQAFMYLDLNNFKSVNDTAGHAAGDLAISQVAARFRDVVRGRDTLARLGGDEFGLLLERCPPERARQRAAQLHEAVESYVLHWNGETYRLGVSIGVAIFKTRHHSLNTILAAADAACYEAKRHNGDGPRIQEVALD